MIRGENGGVGRNVRPLRPDPRRTRRHSGAHPRVRPSKPDLRDGYGGRDGTVDGLCYCLAEAYFHAKGGQDSGLEIYCLSWSDVRPVDGGTHWYLRDPERDVWIDLGLERAADGTHIPTRKGARGPS